MNIQIESAEEFQGITTLLLSNGHKVAFPTDRLIDYIKANELNVITTECGVGSMCDPNCREWTECKTVDAEKHLDDKWDAVTESYYRNVVLKQEVNF